MKKSDAVDVGTNNITWSHSCTRGATERRIREMSISRILGWREDPVRRSLVSGRILVVLQEFHHCLFAVSIHEATAIARDMTSSLKG